MSKYPHEYVHLQIWYYMSVFPGRNIYDSFICPVLKFEFYMSDLGQFDFKMCRVQNDFVLIHILCIRDTEILFKSTNFKNDQ